MILLIDNYDSFVHNLARYVRELGEEAVVRRHDATTLKEIAALGPSHIIISPGPRSPAEAGISTEVIRRFRATTPILGVCLGHQCVAAAYGAAIVRAARPMHGKASEIRHDGRGIFTGLPNPFRAARYHSLVVARERLRHPVIGLQFHPESVLTEHGYRLLDRFLSGPAARGELLPDRADGARSLPDAEGREHTREDVVGRHDADQLVERGDRGAEVRRRGGRLDSLGPRRAEAVDLVERALESEAVAGARHNGLDVSSSEQTPKRGLGETALESVEPFAGQRGHKRDGGRGTGDG